MIRASMIVQGSTVQLVWNSDDQVVEVTSVIGSFQLEAQEALELCNAIRGVIPDVPRSTGQTAASMSAQKVPNFEELEVLVDGEGDRNAWARAFRAAAAELGA